MSILTSARASSVDRGYAYYLEGRVKSYEKIEKDEYQATVSGTQKEPYHVTINVKHPKKSSCTCPFANGRRICKHMIALYFTVFPEEAKDYQSWLESEYCDDYYEDYYDDYYDDYNEEYYFERPLCFDELLENYINRLSKEELKKILKFQLERDEEYTFYTYLQDDYKKYLQTDNNGSAFIEKLNKELTSILKHVDYNYYDNFSEILTKEEKNKITKLYDHNKEFASMLDNLLLNPKLAIYDDYAWIAKFYKNHLDKISKERYINLLNQFFKYLKNYHISNQTPKVNTLVTIYLLSDFTLKDITDSMITNARYKDYVEYLIEHTKNKKELYKLFKNNVERNKYSNKKALPDIFLQFCYQLDYDNNIYDDYLYYDTIYNKKKSSFIQLQEASNFNEYVNKIQKEITDKEVLEIMYATTNKVDELYNLLVEQNKDYLYIRNIDILKDKYTNQLYQLFYQRAYEILDEGTGREIYSRAARYICYIAKLDNGKILVNQLIEELKNSKHSKKYALFDEIDKMFKIQEI